MVLNRTLPLWHNPHNRVSHDVRSGLCTGHSLGRQLPIHQKGRLSTVSKNQIHNNKWQCLLNAVLNCYSFSRSLTFSQVTIVNIHTESPILRSITKSHSKIICVNVVTLGHLERLVFVNFETCRLICPLDMKIQFFIICSCSSHGRLFILRLQCPRNCLWQTAQPETNRSLTLYTLNSRLRNWL